MKLRHVFLEARKTLEAAGIIEASFEAELLLRSLAGLSRADFYRDIDTDITPDIASRYEIILNRRCEGYPSAYLTGRQEFYSLDFRVNSQVLIPRPETELLVEKAINTARTKGYETAIDAGTGSGVIAVTLAVHVPKLKIIAIDISNKALETAYQNAVNHGVENQIVFQQGNLLENLQMSVDMICANLPYVPTEEIPVTGPLSYEPRNALDGGPDGLGIISLFCRSVSCCLNPYGTLLMEVGAGQASHVVGMLKAHLPQADYEVYPDYAGIARLILVSLT